MLTVNRIHDFLNSAFEWDELLRRQMASPIRPDGPRVAVNEHSVVLEIDLPGVDRDSIDIEVDKNLLTISVQPKEATPEETGTWKLQERPEWKNSLEFRLPFTIVPDNSNVTLTNGVLTATFHKPAEEAPKKLEVK